jgi:hypothetical protein
MNRWMMPPDIPEDVAIKMRQIMSGIKRKQVEALLLAEKNRMAFNFDKINLRFAELQELIDEKIKEVKNGSSKT